MSRRGLLLVAATAAALTGATAVRAQAPRKEDLDELAKDVAHFADAAKEYRQAANDVIRRTKNKKQNEIRDKYEPQIKQNEKDERDRRADAIAMFEAFLGKYPTDKRWTPDAMFRLAELYYEKSAEEFLTAQEVYQKALDSPNPPMTPPPKVDYTKTIDLYKRLLTEFPNYRLLDASYYLLGYCLGEMGQDAQAKQALLALVCANKYRALDPPPPTAHAPDVGSSKLALEDPYKECTPIRKDSKFLPEAWTRIGEFHFDAAYELPLAIAAYTRVLDFKESSYYDKAIYKLAWSYYRDNRFPEAVRWFDNLVKFADSKKAAGEKFGQDLRPEAITYLAISFAETDWDGDTQPDAETGLQRAEKFYAGREKEPHVREIFQRLGDIYFDTTKYAEAIAVYKAGLAKWPYYSGAPQVQQQIIRAYEKDRNLVQAAKEREALGRNYVKGTEWARQNRDNPEALAKANELAEDALLTAATNVHAAAQACKGQWQQNPSDLKKLGECKAMYKNAAELYEKYLGAYPNSRKTYEFSFFYADTLFYSDQLEAAATAYLAVRDSNLDNKYQEDSAFQALKSYEGIIEKMKADKKLDDPPIPDEKNTKPPVSPIPMPEIYQKYSATIDWYVEHIKTDRTPTLKYATAVLQLRYKNWPEARKRLYEVTDLYCKDKPDIGFQAYDAILQTYLIENQVTDPVAQDCALGQLLTVADKFAESACGKNDKAKAFIARMATLRGDVKTKVITESIIAAQECEDDPKKCVPPPSCKEGLSGRKIVAGGKGENVTGLSREQYDDLLEIVNNNPKDQNAPLSLNNACVIAEKLYDYQLATQCYERLYRDYGSSKFGPDALWRATINHEKFFEFDQAVKGYLAIAEDPKFKTYEHRKEAIGLAATMLDNDQQYGKAADLFKRYSAEIKDKPADSSSSYVLACRAYEKAKDPRKATGCWNDYIKAFNKETVAGEDIVKAYMAKAVIVEENNPKDKAGIRSAYQKVRDEFVNRKLPPATPAAGFAAKVDFLAVEDKLDAFKAKKLNIKDQKTMKKNLDAFEEEAKALADDYKKVWDYKDATWTLAAMLRQGDVYYEYAQKLIKAADDPSDDIKKLEKMACKANPDDCGVVIQQYKDAIFQFVAPVEDAAKSRWKDTLSRASDLGVTNEYVKKARENLSKYLPDEFPFLKDERIGVEPP